MSTSIQLFNTFVHPLAAQEVSKILASTFLSEGAINREFEKRLESDLGLTNCATVNSGTAALHLSLVMAGVKPGDEVVLPAQTFVASGLVVLQLGAVPVFADIEYENGNISIPSLRMKLTSRTKAIMPVHWGGYPCDMDEIKKLAREHGIPIVEDAAHALGARYKDRPVGTLSDYTCFSFQAIKHLTTGDGGAICTGNQTNLEGAKTRRWFGINRANSPMTVLGERSYNITEVGYKYHMNDYAAALGLANLSGFNERMIRRREVANYYTKQLAKQSGIKLFDYQPDRMSAYWLFGFHVEGRENFIKSLRDKGIAASVVHQRIDRNKVFGGLSKDLVNQAKFDDTQIHIPIHDGIDMEKAAYIVDVIRKGW